MCVGINLLVNKRGPIANPVEMLNLNIKSTALDVQDPGIDKSHNTRYSRTFQVTSLSITVFDSMEEQKFTSEVRKWSEFYIVTVACDFIVVIVIIG